jgi:hypothetical protein
MIFKYLNRKAAFHSPSLGSFWGISDREQGRPTADIRGNFHGPSGRKRSPIQEKRGAASRPASLNPWRAGSSHW